MSSSSSSSSISSSSSRYGSLGLWAIEYSISLLDDDERMSMDELRSIDVLKKLDNNNNNNNGRIFKNICTLCENNAINDLRLLLANLSFNNKDILLDVLRNTIRYSDNGQSPLHIAIEKGSIQLVELLLQRGSPVDSVELKNLCTPLHTAAINSFNKCIPILIVFGANVIAQSSTGRCPLHYAAANGNLETIKELSKGISLTSLRNDNNSNNVNNFEYSLHIKDLDGHTPLHLAIIDGNINCIQYLIQMGSDLNCKDNDGRNALDICQLMGHSEPIISLLINNNSNSTDNTLKSLDNSNITNTLRINDTNLIGLLPNEDYWVVIKETNMLQDEEGNVVVHKTKQSAAIWANKSRKYEEEKKDYIVNNDASEKQGGNIINMIRKTARRLSSSSSSSSSSKDNEKKLNDFKLYVAKLDTRRYKAFQMEVPFVINTSYNDDDDDPNWRQFKSQVISNDNTSNSKLPVTSSEVDRLKQEIENVKNEIASLEADRASRTAVMKGGNDSQIHADIRSSNDNNNNNNNNNDDNNYNNYNNNNNNNPDGSANKRLSVKEIKIIFEKKSKTNV